MKEHKFILIGERPLHFFQTYYGTVGWLENDFPSDIAWFSKDYDCRFYYDERDISGQLRLWRRVLINPKYFSQLEKEWLERKIFTVSFFKKIDPEKSSDLELFQGYKLITELYRDYQGKANAAARLFDRYAMQKLYKELERQKVSDVDSAVTILTSVSKESYLAKEEKHFWQGVLKASNSKQLNKFFLEHLKRYSWVGRSYMEEPALTLKDLQGRLKRVPLKERKQKIAHIDEVLRDNLAARNKIIKTYRLNAETIKYSNLLRESAFFKDFVRGLLAESYFYSDKLFTELEKRSLLNRYQIKALTIPEFEEIFLKKKPADLKVIAKRIKGPYLVGVKNHKTIIIYGKAAEGFEKKFLIDPTKNDQKEFKGRTACPGKVSGNVRIVYKLEDMKKLKVGEILVVNNTNPAFVSYLRKAAAIIAAEGGVTVHAAVVAREMRIPCIIGIKDATRLFQDGDFVEVDANKGIVRKLK